MGDDERPGAGRRADYIHFVEIATRGGENDVYGHMNNVVHYALFDTAVNRMLIEAGALDIHAGPTIGLVVETGCRYFAAAAFPDRITAGVRVARLGGSSVRYKVGLFRNDEDQAIAEGFFVHVYVDRERRRPMVLPEELKAALTPLLKRPHVEEGLGGSEVAGLETGGGDAVVAEHELNHEGLAWIQAGQGAGGGGEGPDLALDAAVGEQGRGR